MKVVKNLSLYVVEHDVPKSVFYFTQVVLMWIVEKVELNYLISEL